jgi:hypothetical protein
VFVLQGESCCSVSALSALPLTHTSAYLSIFIPCYDTPYLSQIKPSFLRLLKLYKLSFKIIQSQVFYHSNKNGPKIPSLIILYKIATYFTAHFPHSCCLVLENNEHLLAHCVIDLARLTLCPFQRADFVPALLNSFDISPNICVLNLKTFIYLNLTNLKHDR